MLKRPTQRGRRCADDISPSRHRWRRSLDPSSSLVGYGILSGQANVIVGEAMAWRWQQSLYDIRKGDMIRRGKIYSRGRHDP